eukprot:364975-Chlamydomonas_euryale.AAC.3
MRTPAGIVHFIDSAIIPYVSTGPLPPRHAPAATVASLLSSVPVLSDAWELIQRAGLKDYFASSNLKVWAEPCSEGSNGLRAIGFVNATLASSSKTGVWVCRLAHNCINATLASSPVPVPAPRCLRPLPYAAPAARRLGRPSYTHTHHTAPHHNTTPLATRRHPNPHPHNSVTMFAPDNEAMLKLLKRLGYKDFEQLWAKGQGYLHGLVADMTVAERIKVLWGMQRCECAHAFAAG